MGRKGGKIIPTLLTLAVLVGGGYYGYLWWNGQLTDQPPGPGLTPTPAPTTAGGLGTDVSDDDLKETRVVANPDTNPEQRRNKVVKAEVLKRIDAYPELNKIAPDQKEKLYDLISKARAMGCVMIIPFAEGQDKLKDNEKQLLIDAAKSSAIQKMTQDPTMLLFVLGYADKVGDNAKKNNLSLARANSVVSTLRDDAEIINLINAIGMGSTDLFNDAAAVQNRRVEVWAVFPQ